MTLPNKFTKYAELDVTRLSNELVDVMVQFKTVTITSAQVLAGHTTAIEIVPAPGVGKALIVLGFFYSLGGSVGYSGGATKGIGYGSIENRVGDVVDIDTANTVGYIMGDSNAGIATSIVENQPIVYNSSANPTLGNGDLKITVAYATCDI